MLHKTRSRAGEEEPLLAAEVRWPLEMARAGEAQVRAEGFAHGVDEPAGALITSESGAAASKAILDVVAAVRTGMPLATP